MVLWSLESPSSLSRFRSTAPHVASSSVPPFTYFESISTTQHLNTKKLFIFLFSLWLGDKTVYFCFTASSFFLKGRWCMCSRVLRFICLVASFLFCNKLVYLLYCVFFLNKARSSNVNFLIVLLHFLIDFKLKWN